jgi:hypothetical protein
MRYCGRFWYISLWKSFLLLRAEWSHEIRGRWGNTVQFILLWWWNQENEMDGTCRIREEMWSAYRSLVGKTHGKRSHGKRRLKRMKLILEKGAWGCRLGTNGSGWGLMADFCEAVCGYTSSKNKQLFKVIFCMTYKDVSKSFRTGRLERELQMVHISATRCSCIAILWVSLIVFAAITLSVASQRVFVFVYFVIDSVWKLLDTPS